MRRRLSMTWSRRTVDMIGRRNGTSFLMAMETLFTVQVAAEITGDEPEIPYLNRTIRSYNNASCDVFKIHIGQRDLRGAQWEAVPDLGEYSMFLGKSYPRMIRISPQMMSMDCLMHAGDDG